MTVCDYCRDDPADYGCQECGGDFCESHSTKCASCGERYCPTHLGRDKHMAWNTDERLWDKCVDRSAETISAAPTD
jgi:hypothetical protein